MHYFVYLLQSLHTPTTTRMYIGFTPKPRRRLRQHNGEIKGGAKKTSQHRPWEHVCIVSGFPNKFVAYMFEHQWQSCFGHMRPSRVIKDALVGLDYRSKGWKGRFMVLHTMLQLPLWKQMNLAVHFLKPAQQVYFESLQRALAAPDRTECKVRLRLRLRLRLLVLLSPALTLSLSLSLYLYLSLSAHHPHRMPHHATHATTHARL